MTVDVATPTRDEYRDAFREVMRRLLDYELGRPRPTPTALLRRVIEMDAEAAVSGR